MVAISLNKHLILTRHAVRTCETRDDRMQKRDQFVVCNSNAEGPTETCQRFRQDPKLTI